MICDVFIIQTRVRILLLLYLNSFDNANCSSHGGVDVEIDILVDPPVQYPGMTIRNDEGKVDVYDYQVTVRD